MKEYTEKIKKLIDNFSLKELEILLEEIDKEILNNKTTKIDEEFLYYFEIIMSFISDNYMIDGEYIELGHILLDKKLKEKKRITPTLLIYFYLEQKRKIGLSQYCNNVVIDNFEYYMGITKLDDGSEELKINLNLFQEVQSEEEFNYFMMHNILHEIIHIYQNAKKENTDNIFDKLIYYDKLCSEIFIRNLLNGTSGQGVIHESLVSEFMAEENADIYMFEIAKKNQEYFSKELIERKRFNYQWKKNSNSNFFCEPRIAFQEIIDYTRKIYINNGFESYKRIEPIFKQLEMILKKIKPLVEELKKQGISENVIMYEYYNIYLKKYYNYDGENIIFRKEKDPIK